MYQGASMDEPRVPDPRPERLLVTLLSDPQIWTTVQALARSDVHAADLQVQTLTLAPRPNGPPGPAQPVRPRVLFLCTRNSARSQIAEGLLRMISGGAVDALSAGVAPASLHPLARESLERVGAFTQPMDSKHVDIFAGQHFDYVITVCDQAREVCPTSPNADQQLHWSLPDPAAAEVARQPKAFQAVSIELAQRIRYLLTFIERDRRQAGTGARV
jgi:protein-tyrosine-phosphatase